MVVVWNAKSAVPVRTLFEAHPGGIISLDMTPDAMYIATVGAGPNQDLSVWEWTVQKDEPMYTSPITSKDVQHCVRFRRDDYNEIITNGSARTIFWNIEDGALKFYSPAISSKEFLTPVGRFTQSIFIPNSTQAVTATEDGDVLLWDQVLVPTPLLPTNVPALLTAIHPHDSTHDSTLHSTLHSTHTPYMTHDILLREMTLIPILFNARSSSQLFTLAPLTGAGSNSCASTRLLPSPSSPSLTTSSSRRRQTDSCVSTTSSSASWLGMRTSTSALL